jgi:hypothetical protein
MFKKYSQKSQTKIFKTLKQIFHGKVANENGKNLGLAGRKFGLMTVLCSTFIVK